MKKDVLYYVEHEWFCHYCNARQKVQYGETIETVLFKHEDNCKKRSKIMSNEKVYAKGIYYDKPRESAPDFILGSISVKLDDFMSFAGEHVNQKGYVNMDILEGREKPYVQLNTWTPPEKEEYVPQQQGFDANQDIPF